jgi:hypothetical protein
MVGVWATKSLADDMKPKNVCPRRAARPAMLTDSTMCGRGEQLSRRHEVHIRVPLIGSSVSDIKSRYVRQSI